MIKFLLVLWLPSVLGEITPPPLTAKTYHFRLIIQKNHLRFILSSKQPLKYNTKRLSSPARFILDIPKAELTTPEKKTNLSNRLIKSFNMTQKNGHLRIVFDLDKEVQSKVHTEEGSPNEHQLIVDFAKSYSHQKLDIPTPPKEFLVTKNQRPQKSLLHLKKMELASNETSSQTQMPVKIPGKRDIVIVIDPGHGGKDPGAIGRLGHREKTVVLAIAKRLVRTINRQSGFRARLTRQGDYYIGLRERLRIARQARADLFISIHADAFHNPASRGASVFALSQRGATSEAAKWLANRENASETLGDEKLNNKDRLLSSVLINLSQNHAISESVKIGKSILIHFNAFSKLHYRHVEQAAFVVLKSPDIPSLLVETGFISNPYEERRLATSSYQERIAHALMVGIKQHFVSNPPPDTLIAMRQARYLKF